jgi:hypothetical protein
MNYENTNWAPLTDIVESIANSEELKDAFEILNRRKIDDPARFELQYSKILIDQNMSAEANVSCAVSRFFALNDMRANCFEDDFDQSKFDELYEEYHDYVLAAAKNIKRYRDHRKVLLKKVRRQDQLNKRPS